MGLSRFFDRLVLVFRGTGLGLSLFLAGISFAFLIIPYVDFCGITLALLAAFCVAFVSFILLIKSDISSSGIDQLQVGIALLSGGIGLVSTYLSFKDEQWFWTFFGIASLVLTIRFIALRAQAMNKRRRRR